MLTKQDIVNQILRDKSTSPNSEGKGFAPSNIALAKYWGKRNQELNLPTNSSLSISLGSKGANAQITFFECGHLITINKKPLYINSEPGNRLSDFLNLFNHDYQLTLDVNIPFAAGLASSACIFAAIVLALNDLHQWKLNQQELSILARLGSGSAARSIDLGFVEWHMGEQHNGMDSFAQPLNQDWPDFCVGLVIFDERIKKVSSRSGMQRTLATSPLYSAWPAYANSTVTRLKKAIANKDFATLGYEAEHNAMSMHATMMSAWPPIIYSTAETLQTMQTVWKLREEGLSLYFTQDAGPNLKLLFLESDIEVVKQRFTTLEIIQPFRG